MNDNSDTSDDGAESLRRTSVAAETRENLINAAVEVFLEKGYDGVRVQDITRKAGYTTGALYAHFDSRTAILTEAITREGKKLIGRMVDRASTISPGEGAVMRALAELMTEEERPLDRLLTEAMALAVRDQNSRAVLLPAFEALAGEVRSATDLAQALKVVHPDFDPDAVAAFFFTMIMGSVVTRALALGGSDKTALITVLQSVRQALGAPPALVVETPKNDIILG